MKKYIISDQNGRLDKVIPELDPSVSRSRAKNLIDDGHVHVNGEAAKPKYKVKPNDQVEIEDAKPQPISLEPENIPLDIVYEDDDVIVVNKPQGMVVHPSPGHPDHTLVNALLYHSPLSTINGEYRPGIVHRIDKDTSGLLMVAKNDAAHKFLSQQLKEQKSLRKYVALVHGRISEDSGVVNAPIGRSPKDRKKQAIVPDGRHAVTHFEVLERFADYTLVACRLETGRTHQIRVHMKYIGHPIVGDPLYGPRKTIAGNGQFLHAQELGFEHPKTHELMIFSAPLPEIFERTLNNLRLNNALGS
ncbi:RluA family pseudouridine synthase [Lentilactobacillus otakiensis]|uniref:Pseudouridine synthase n=1 Tax=Lentilactobacillus otakiensis DSM 19908 = JCM 15040 TaxID=1423780 RepID=S4NIH2_9LACO|nr:RluA family pseudouridine synthase [Lentilactobacillus otakiensis]KRL09196.1 RluA family pseudouridine synthase [Lentilactobacillus otakiensis DSM 19908 = JCM 15040]MBZ3775813.1 RluA family pseudouridine synthase [Lentilactobacillus otakiensis]MDV3519032.1 RluA family pseudouridine synthase [Lentilactobacillus otakiensis]GAD15801.1 pseudouridine synthase D [Lentilactobacillus otakiensis DSM 19908 = JCM 15040]